VPLVSEKLAPVTLRQQVADRVRNAILSGALHPGERLVERKISTELGTSLTAVREALIQLETEGFIRKKTNTNTFVSDFSRSELEGVFAVRRLLEGYAFEEAARRATAAECDKLQDLFAQTVEAARREDRQSYIRRDLLWHDAVWQTARNECLLESLRRIIYPLFGFSAIRVASQPGFDLLADAQSHDPLLKAIRQNEPAAARRAFDEAMEAWKADALSYFSRPV